VALAGEGPLEHLAQRGVVVDDEDLQGLGHQLEPG
jgi:hypothetical protein